MSKRDELFHKFGPLQNEALLLLTLAAINELRTKAGLTPYTQEEAFTALDQILSSLEPYDWMKDQP